MRKVKVLANGKWKFMKGKAKCSKKGKSCSRRTTTRKGKTCTVTKAQAKGKARYVKIKGRYCRVR